MAIATVKPGILVSFSTLVHDSGLSRTTRPQDTTGVFAPEGASVMVTRTETIMRAPEEHATARKLASNLTNAVRRLCSATPFLWHCTFDNADSLYAAVDGARRAADEHNATANYTRVSVYFYPAIVGLDASDEDKIRAREAAERSARDMATEIARILDEMNRGIDSLSPETIRDAVARAETYAAMLTDDQSSAITSAIDSARKAARTITKLSKKGTDAAVILASVTRADIATARIRFLDLDAVDLPAPENAMPAANLQRVAGLDIDTPPVPSVDVVADLRAAVNAALDAVEEPNAPIIDATPETPATPDVDAATAVPESDEGTGFALDSDSPTVEAETTDSPKSSEFNGFI